MASFDTDSLRLALELHLRDVEGLQTTASGRKRKRKVGDFDVALEVYQEHLTAEILSVGGRVPATPTAEASTSRPRKRVATGRRKTAAPRARIRRARQAKVLVEQTAAAAQTANAVTEKEMSVRASATIAYLDTSKANATSTDVENAVAASVGVDNALRCSVCMEVQYENPTFRMPCEDLYCVPCLVEHVKATITGGLKFPPECCSVPMTMDGAALALLPADLVTRFEKKQLEVSTPSPRYCSKVDCGEFIPPANFRGDRGRCSACQTWTCIHCRAAEHTGLCSADPAQEGILTLARQGRWRQCFQCRSLVERRGGCAHIFCRCTAEFCYHCGVKWKRCHCQYN